MFKVKKEERTSKTFRMPESLLSQLQKVAQKEGVSMNNLVIQCCEYALKDFDKKKKYVAED